MAEHYEVECRARLEMTWVAARQRGTGKPYRFNFVEAARKRAQQMELFLVATRIVRVRADGTREVVG